MAMRALLVCFVLMTVATASGRAEDTDRLNDTRVFTRPECPISAPPPGVKGASALAAAPLIEIAKLFVGSAIKFSGTLIKNFGKETSVKLLATAPVNFYSVKWKEHLPTDELELNKDWKCIILIKGEFGGEYPAANVKEWAKAARRKSYPTDTSEVKNLGVDDLVRDQNGDAVLDANGKQVTFPQFNLKDVPEIYFEGEVTESIDGRYFNVEARHLKVSGNQDWSLLTGRRDVVLALQFDEGANSVTAGLPTDQQTMAAWRGALPRTGFALGTIDFRDVRAPFEVSKATLATKMTGWMGRGADPTKWSDTNKGPGTKLAGLKSELKTACETLVRAFATKDGILFAKTDDATEPPTEEDGKPTPGMFGKCDEVLERAPAWKQLDKLEKSKPAFFSPATNALLKKQDLDQPAAYVAIREALGAQITELESKSKNPPEVISPELAKLKREKAIVDQVHTVFVKWAELKDFQDDLAKIRGVGKPVNLTVAYIETRSAVTWLQQFADQFGSDISQGSAGLTSSVNSALFPTPPNESQLLTDRFNAQSAALASYATLSEAVAGYIAETDGAKKRAKYYTALAADVDYKNKSRLFVEKGGGAPELPSPPTIPPLN